jgi:thioesterase domain-containing protein/non-ribosomal peptide synthetase component F/acyl carrier protein
MRPPSACEVTHVPVGEMDQAKLDLSVYADNSEEAETPEEGVYVFPASLEQIRYWTLDQLDGASTASNMAIAARLEGKVDDSLVEDAVRAIVERHEALRTTFKVVDGHLSQIISEEAHYNFSVTDLRSLPDTERAQAAEHAVEEHSHARADLATGPAFFARLIHLTDELHFLAFTMHHIVCDGWSNGILIRDFADFYTAFAGNRTPTLPELPFQFADFTVWQQNWLESEAATAAVQYWREHIRRELPAVDLPADNPRLPQKSYPGHIESTLLPATLTARLKAYCRSHNATMHQVMLAAFEGLIARYTNQYEFLLGSTIANRTQPGMENVVGRFANPQVILADVNGDPTFAQLLKRVSDWSSESYAHQDLPFSRLMEEFQLDQAGATSQFLQVYFVYQKAFMQPQEAPGIKIVPRPSISGGVNFDLLVSIVERAEGPRLQMEYNTVLFRKERIVSLIEMYVRVLEAVMEDDSLVVSRLPLMARIAEVAESSSGDSSLVASESQAEMASASLPQWLDRLAAKLGDAPALVIDQESVSWKALQERSQLFASALKARGVTAGNTVALRMESNFDSAAAAWAILEIGAVALPMPASASAAEWSRVVPAQSHGLASAGFASKLTRGVGYEELGAASSSTTPGSESFAVVDPSQCAWLGISSIHFSSAVSDAAMQPASHGATLHQLLAAVSALDLRAEDQFLVMPAQSATDAWIDLLLPLAAGATVVYPGKGQGLKSAIDRREISFLMASTQDVLTGVHQRWVGDRRLSVILRGGILSATQAKRIHETPLRLWSLLSSPAAAGPLAIARAAADAPLEFAPVGGIRLVVVDESEQQVPSGVSGELAILSGTGKMRTGLLARTAPDAMRGSGLQILDYADHLVRLHGYRLRLSELEDLLWQDPNVAEVAATLTTANGSPTLAAYFRTFGPGTDAVRSVREQFQAAAPGHLKTAELISVEAIERLSDGSPDFTLLPAAGTAQPVTDAVDEYFPPRDELETQLVGIWEEVLGIRPIGTRTSFFKLGGYSLMIVRLFGRINKVLGTSLPITTIFNAPTVEQLADTVRGRAYYSSLVPVNPTGTKPPFFMIHSYLLYQGIPKVLGPEHPFYGLRELDTDAEGITVEQRAAAYLDAIRSIQPAGPYYLGGWCAAGPLAVETARQITASGEKVGFLVLFDSWRPGYAADLAREQAGSAEMTLRARLSRKYRFHARRFGSLSAGQKVQYIASAFSNKFAKVRDRLYLKNWAIAEWFCKRFGLPLPHFMHNVSLTTLNSLKEYRGIEPYTGSLMLIRAKEAPYIPGAQEHCGWNSIVTGGVNVVWANGDHESMFLDPHLQTVGELLHQGLNEAYAQQAD